jgi:aryl-alcohol dehydrogenase-like predicted oxidoreductase
MKYRRFGRLGWSVGEIGYGMWGLAGWTGSDEAETDRALDRAVELGCNFFDTAWAYGAGASEAILGRLLRRHVGVRLHIATKVPPKNMTWPSRRGMALGDVFPGDHIREYASRSLKNLKTDRIDLLQFHVWEDEWAEDERWRRAIEDLKREGVIAACGISVNRWEPANGLRTLRSGAVDAVQVIYNIFDQAPEDELFPLCRELDIAVIARVPFDEGSLTGTLTYESKWPEGDWRNTYFVAENLRATVDRVERLRPLVPRGMGMAEFALRWILAESTVSTIIPGMRKLANVEANCAASDGVLPSVDDLARVREHRWDRSPTKWSQ